LVSVILAVLSISCGGSDNQKEKKTEKEEVIEMPDPKQVDMVKVGKLSEAIITSIPSSPEVEQLFNEMGMEYQMELLNPYDHVSKYQLISDKAINLGIYLCDLGYISAFDQTQELMLYINSTKTLSEGIGVSEVISEKDIENLELNMDNEDSLQTIIRRIYDQTYVFLDENNRLSTATLLVAGGWIEGLYIASQIVNIEDPHPQMIHNIIKQRVVYEQLIELLGNFEQDPAAYKIRNELKEVGPVLYRIQQHGDNKTALLELRAKITALRTECIIY